MTSAAPASSPPLSSRRPDFGHVETWVFDLDNTLYPRECNLFAQIDALITAYVIEVTRLDFAAARALQKTYYRDFGTTLNGLMQRHGVDPEHFLRTVHAIDYSPVAAHPALVEAIAALPGRKYILTNGDVPHARAVLERLGGGGLFDGIHDVRAMSYRPKPMRAAYEGFVAAYGIDPGRAIFFDDLDKNLVVPHEIGMTTVHVVAGEDYSHQQVEAWEIERPEGPHIHHRTSDLAAFLKAAI
jgi:putative hydrolase of the HAD superfamily